MAEKLGVTYQTVDKWRQRFLERRLDGFLGEPRPRGAGSVTRILSLTEKQLCRGVHRSTRELESAIRHYLELNNRHPKPFIWTKTADQILDSVARFCKRSSDSGH